MNILHYSLGLPPYRSGGLTKYSSDLIKEESKNNKVYLLFPGKISFVGDKVRVKLYKKENNIDIYELVNPLPVPLLNGIINPNVFMKSCHKGIFKEFLLNNAIEVIHIHTFMGLYKEFLESAKELNIKIVYTTHDYFGICFKGNFIDYRGELCEKKELNKCIKCNKYSYSLNLIKIIQHPIYRLLKSKGIITKLKYVLSKVKNKNNEFEKFNFEDTINDQKTIIKLSQLDSYYREMFNYIDKFLFNSSIAKEIYNSYGIGKGDVIGITHSDIKDNRVEKLYNNNKLRITYLGPYKKYKGFYLLLDVMRNINFKYKQSIELNIYGEVIELNEESNIKFRGKYEYSDLSNIFNETDLLIVPSIWYETFGFVTLEAQSYGVPVLTTKNVGSKDILSNNKGVIVDINKDEIYLILEKIINNREILIEFNKNINNGIFAYSMSNHYKKVMEIYKEK